ncbi:MAG: hypothetical protein ACFCU4_02530 [Puniceicoccaceae bacterium]
MKPSETPGEENQTTARWWLYSILIHLGLLAILFLTPAKDYFFGPKTDQPKPEITVSSQRVEAVARKVDQNQREIFEARLEELLQISEQMEAIKMSRHETYQEIAAILGQEAPERALSALEKALLGMRSASDAQKAARIVLEPAPLATEGKEMLETTGVALPKLAEASRSQRDVRAAQIELTNQFGFLEIPELNALQTIATTDQEKADDAQASWAEEVENARRASRMVVRYQSEVERKDSEVQTQKGRVARIENSLQSVRAEIEDLEAQLAAESPSDPARLERTLRDRNARLERLQRELDHHSTRLETFVEELASRGANYQRAIETLEHSLNRQKTLSQEATSLQEIAYQSQTAVAEALQLLTLEEPEPPQPELARVSEQPDLSTIPLPDLLEYAVTLENQIAEDFDQISIASSAIIRQTSFAEAQRTTEKTVFNRDEIDTGILARTPASSEEMLARRETLRSMGDQLNSMVSTSRDLLALVSSSPDLEVAGVDINLEWLRQQAEEHEALQLMALEDAGARAKDLTQIMTGLYNAEFAALQVASSSPATRTLGSSSGPPSLQREEVARLPGRRITASEEAFSSGRWMFVDGWYAVGPFPNQGRRNVDTRFPPETAVNLDARYLGLEDQIIQWEFVKANDVFVSPPNDPPYAITYYYTELWFDEPLNTWIAIGSDDNSRIWIEDTLVWLSSYNLKAWRIDEGFRKVHFRRGINRILVRVENGHGASGFSLAIQL